MSRRWFDLIERVLTVLAARPGLAGVPIRRTGEIREVVVPSLGWTNVVTTRGDGTEAVVLQVDVWAATFQALLDMEGEVRSALDRAVCFSVNGLRILSVFQSMRIHPDATEGELHASLDFRLEAVQ